MSNQSLASSDLQNARAVLYQRPPLTALVLILGMAAVLALLQGAPASAAPDQPAGCFTSDSYPRFTVAYVPGTVLRDDDGTDADIFSVPFEAEADDYRVVVSDASGETVGPRCAPATRLNPPSPAASAEWLPGATAEGPGVQGSVRVSWDPVSDNGVGPSHYEVIRSGYPNRLSERSTAPIDSVVVDGSARSAQVFTGLSSTEVVLTVRAWWPDGVSAPTPVDLPEQRREWGEPWAPNGPRVVDYVRATSSPSDSFPMRIRWESVVDHRGQQPDSYQVVSFNNRDGNAPLSWSIDHTFPGSVTEGSIIYRSNFLGGTRAIRAVWNDGGPAGGPQIAEAPLDPTGDLVISNAEVTERRTTAAKVSFTTDRCTYGDWRVVVNEDLDNIDEFNAPRDGVCYTDHGITIGVDTPPLPPGANVVVSVVLTDPETGAAELFIRAVFTRQAEVAGAMVDVAQTASGLVLEGWAVDTTRSAGEAVRVHAFVNGRWRPGQAASRPLPTDTNNGFGGALNYTEAYGSNLRFRLEADLPSTGNYLVCLKGVDADAAPLPSGRPLFVDLGCHAVIRNSDQPIGEITEAKRAGRNRVVVTGIAFEADQLLNGDENTRVVVRVDGKAVRRGWANGRTGRIVAPGEASCTGCPASFRLAVDLPVGADRVCVSALNPDGPNKHLGCRRL